MMQVYPSILLLILYTAAADPLYCYWCSFWPLYPGQGSHDPYDSRHGLCLFLCRYQWYEFTSRHYHITFSATLIHSSSFYFAGVREAKGLELLAFDPSADPDINRHSTDQDTYARFANCFYNQFKIYAANNFRANNDE